MKHIFIVNPTSGGGSAREAISPIHEIAKEKKLNYDLIFTEYPGHAKELAANYSIKEEVCLYSVGGDGTAYEILNGLSDKVCLSIIPCGTGNDFYRIISETPAASIKQRVLEAVDGRIVEVDYGVSNHTRFLNCTTIGFDADINHMVNTTMKKTFLPPKMMYLTAALSKMIVPPKHQVKIQIDDEVIKQSVLLVAIMNGRYYGGGFNPTPDASIQDGLFDICIVEPMSRARMVTLIGRYMNGKHTDLKQVKMRRGRHISISLNDQVVMQSDGEDFIDNRITFDLMQSALRLKVPQNSSLK